MGRMWPVIGKALEHLGGTQKKAHGLVSKCVLDYGVP